MLLPFYQCVSDGRFSKGDLKIDIVIDVFFIDVKGVGVIYSSVEMKNIELLHKYFNG